jgi:dTDP-4-amino-4,6-dideoxygalactose transaminase
MENAPHIIARRNLIYDLYIKGLRPLAEKNCFRLPCVLNDCAINGHIFFIITKSLKQRVQLSDFLRDRDISTVFHYVPLHSSPAGALYGKAYGKMEVTDRVSDCLLRLPLYFEMTEDDVQSVVDGINDFYENR